MGVCFLHVFDPSTPKASNRDPNFRDFLRVIFSLFWPLKIKISRKKLYGHNPVEMLNHIGFQNFKKVEFWLKNRHFKNIV